MAYIHISGRSGGRIGQPQRPYAQRHVPLQLSAPQAPVVAIDAAVVIPEDAGVDAVGAPYGVLLRREGPLRPFGNGHTQAELAATILGREYQVVAAVFLHHIAVPHLLLHPGHLLLVEDNTVVGGMPLLNVVKREHVVVAHLEVPAVIVKDIVALAVVAGVYIQSVVKHMAGRVGHIVAGE